MANEGAFTLAGTLTPDQIRRRIGKATAQDATQFGLQFANAFSDPKQRALAQIGGAFGAGLSGGFFDVNDPRIAAAQNRQNILSNIKEPSRENFLQAGVEALKTGDIGLGSQLLQSSRALPSNKPKIDVTKLNGKAQLLYISAHPEEFGDQLSQDARVLLNPDSLKNQSEVVKNQIRRREILKKLEQNPNDSLARKELKELNNRIAKLDTIVGRTETDRQLSAAGMDKLIAQRDSIRSGVERVQGMIDVVQADPSRAGVVGTLRRGAQVLLGSSIDLSSLFGDAGATFAKDFVDSVTQEAKNDHINKNIIKTLFDPKLSEINLFENSMAYKLARSRKPSGRINQDDIERAGQDVKVTGLTSAADVVNRLRAVEKEFRSADEDITNRIGDQNFLDNKLRIIKTGTDTKTGRRIVMKSDDKIYYADTDKLVEDQ